MHPLKMSLRWLAGALLLTPMLFSAVEDDELPPPGMTEYWTPQPPVVSAEPGKPPSDAIVLFDGTLASLDAWKSTGEDGGPVPWKIVDGALVVQGKTGDIITKQGFGDVQLHIEWRTPPELEGSGQGRGNSGVFFMNRYEVQILDSYENPTYVNGQAASLYKQHPPLVNAMRPSGEWQIYDIVFVAPRFSPDGTVLSKARVTVFHNGVLTQHAAELDGPTVYRGLPRYQYHTPRQPIRLQDHKDPVSFRNIWLRELDLP